jgi:RNase P/RNase MRP subunit POP5
MTASDKTTRKRYIAFQINAPRTISRSEFIYAIRDREKSNEYKEGIKPWLTVFDNNQGILRCAHTKKDEAVRLLSSIKSVGREKMPVKVITLGTSGTIKTARRRYLDRGKDTR